MAFVLIQHLDPKHESHLTELLSKDKQNAGLGSERRDSRRGQSCLRDSAAMQSGHFRWSPAHPAAAGERPQHADRLLSPRPGGRPRQQGPRRRSVGNRIRWDAGPPGDQSRGRHHLRSGCANREVRRHAEKRHRRRCGGFCAAAGRNRAATGGHRARVSDRRPSLRRQTEPPEDAELAKILRLVRTATGVDFTHYKHGTLARRIKRRMALRGFETLEDYSRDLEQNREEANALVRELFYHRHGILSGTGGLRGTEEEWYSPRWSRIGRPRIPSGSGCLGAPRARRLIPSPSA